jgi:hypothetical protein
MTNNEDEAFQEQSRPLPPRIPDQDPEPEERPRRSRRRDDDDDRDRPRRRSSRERESTDPIETLIPYKNAMALAAYYCGVFGLIPCLGIVPEILGIVFGVIGVRQANANPRVRGMGHAITGIVLGSLGLLAHLVFVIIFLVNTRR